MKAGTNFAYTVEEGDIIGISVAAEDPDLPAEEFQGSKNLRLREVPLSYDRLRLQAGLLVRVSPTAEVNLNYSRVLWGRNTSLSQTVALGLGFQFDIADDGEG